ncbi:MAG: anti-sigma factor family protein [Verrucomicrobiota bacterium]
MNDERLDDLIDQHLNGTMTAESRRELEERLLHSASDRARFWELAETHGVLHEGMQARLGDPQHAATAPSKTAAFSSWLQWRPLTAAAAGLVIGLFSASMVFAYGVTKLVKQVLTLENAGFEQNLSPSPEGIPVRFGVWSGDHAEIVGAQQGITPKEGRQMFRFLRSDNATDLGTVFNGNIYQLVDVRAWRAAIASGTAMVDWSASFNCLPEAAGVRSKFEASVWAFAGETSFVRKNWEEKLHQELAYSSRSILADDDLKSWQPLAGSMIVPPDTDFLVIELKAVPGKPEPVNGVVTFAGKYADDVQLILRTDARQQPVVGNHPRP